MAILDPIKMLYFPCLFSISFEGNTTGLLIIHMCINDMCMRYSASNTGFYNCDLGGTHSKARICNL